MTPDLSEVMLTSCIIVTHLLHLLLGATDAAGVLSNQTQRDAGVPGSFRHPYPSVFPDARPTRSVIHLLF